MNATGTLLIENPETDKAVHPATERLGRTDFRMGDETDNTDDRWDHTHNSARQHKYIFMLTAC